MSSHDQHSVRHSDNLGGSIGLGYLHQVVLSNQIITKQSSLKAV